MLQDKANKGPIEEQVAFHVFARISPCARLSISGLKIKSVFTPNFIGDALRSVQNLFDF